MVKKKLMSLGTLNTILNSAPLIIQGANRLIKMIRERNDSDQNEEVDDTNSLEGFKKELNHVNQRIDAASQSDLEQIKLIEELAKQNELLATTLNRINKQINVLVLFVLLTFVLAGIALYLSISS